MFMGGIMVALAVEYSGLHKRLALRVIQMVGCSPRRSALLSLSARKLYMTLILFNPQTTFWPDYGDNVHIHVDFQCSLYSYDEPDCAGGA